MTSTKPAVFWRDSLPIHPAAELFPLMPPDELRVLGEDIMKNGLRSPIVLWRADDKTPAVLLDGRNRLDAIEMAPGSPVEVRNVVVLDHTTDPYAFVISTNIHRADEIARLNARVDELQNQKRRLEIENVGLRNEIEKLTATNNSLRQQIAELIGAQAKFDNAAPAADDGGMPDIPAFLRKTAS